MPSAWQRSRTPDDVPTPIAIAVSDFCRRAGAAAPPAEVREALACLREDEDFRVRDLTDAEPAARPLGPWALIDVLRGTPEALAATRQQSGYYDLVRELVELRAAQPAEAPAIATAPAPLPWEPAPPQRPMVDADADPGRKRTGKKTEATVQERIAPKKRLAALSDEVPALDPARTREDPRPKGRFATIAPTLQSVDDLFQPEARELLEARVQQHPNRFALTRALGEQFQGRRDGQPLRTEDVERALTAHKLLERIEEQERVAVLGSLTEVRGATSRVALALGLSVSELNRLVKSLGITQEIEEIRDRFRREALSPRNLASRIDLLGRGRYLSDLGIRRKFDEALRGDLKKLLQSCAPRAKSTEDLIAAAAHHEGVQPELLSRAVEKLGLADEAQKLAGARRGHDAR